MRAQTSLPACMLVATVSLTLGARVTDAQTGTCRGADTVALSERSYVRLQVTRDDHPAAQARRTALQLPFVAASEVVQLTSGPACRRASDAYKANVRAQANTLSGAVYLYRVGPTRYVVTDPTYRYSGPTSHLFMVFDDRWRYLAAFY